MKHRFHLSREIRKRLEGFGSLMDERKTGMKDE